MNSQIAELVTADDSLKSAFQETCEAEAACSQPIAELSPLPRNLDARIINAASELDRRPLELEQRIKDATDGLLVPPDWTQSAVRALKIPLAPAATQTDHLSRQQVEEELQSAIRGQILEICEQLPTRYDQPWQSPYEQDTCQVILKQLDHRHAASHVISVALQELRASPIAWGGLSTVAHLCEASMARPQFCRDYQRYVLLEASLERLVNRTRQRSMLQPTRFARRAVALVGLVSGGVLGFLLNSDPSLCDSIAKWVPWLQGVMPSFDTSGLLGGWIAILSLALAGASVAMVANCVVRVFRNLVRATANRRDWILSRRLRNDVREQLQSILKERINIPVGTLLKGALARSAQLSVQDPLHARYGAMVGDVATQFDALRETLRWVYRDANQVPPEFAFFGSALERSRDDLARRLLPPIVAERLRQNKHRLDTTLTKAAELRAANLARLEGLQAEALAECQSHIDRVQAARTERLHSASQALSSAREAMRFLHERLGGQRAFGRSGRLPARWPTHPARSFQLGLSLPVSRPWLGELEPNAPLLPIEIAVDEDRTLRIDPRLSAEQRGGLALDVAMSIVLDNPPGDVKVLLVDSSSSFSALSPLCILMRENRALRAVHGSAIAATLEETEFAIRTLRTELNDRLMYGLAGHRLVEDAGSDCAPPPPRYVVVVISVPRGLSDEAIVSLESLCEPSKGGRAGFHVVWATAEDRESSGGPRLHLHQLRRDCATLTAPAAGVGRWIGVKGEPVVEFLREPASTWAAVARATRQFEHAIELHGAHGQTFADLTRIANGLSANTRALPRGVIEVPIGFDPRGEPVMIQFGSGTSHHGLLIGSAGAGKSRLLQVFVMSAALRYPPSHLEFALIDCKGADDGFRYFADHPSLPHARVVALGADREFACATLRHYLEVMRARHRNARNGTQTEDDERRIIVVLDEYQVLFALEDQTAEDARASITHLVRQGRSARISLLLCSQSSEGMAHLQAEILNELGVRIALRCSERDCDRLFGSSSLLGRITLEQRQGLIASGNPEHRRDPRVFMTATIHSEAEIPSRISSLRVAPIAGQTIFTGDGLTPADELHEALESEETLPNRLLLGRTLGLRGLARIDWVSERRWNLLAVSPPRNDLADRVLASCLWSVGDPSWTTNVRVVSGGRRSDLGCGFLREAVLRCRANTVGHAELEKTIAELAALVRSREASSRKRYEATEFLVLHQIDCMDALDESDYEQDRTTSASLGEVLAKGPIVGVHVLATASSMARVHAMLGPKTKNFGHRVCSRLPQDDVGDLTSGVVLRSLRDDRCAVFSDHLPGQHSTFIPFDFDRTPIEERP